MRRIFALALTVLLLVFTLTACGNRSNDSTQAPTQNETSDTAQSGTDDSGSATNGSGGTASNSGSAANDSQFDQNTTAGDMVDDAVNGAQDAIDDILPGDNANTRQRSTGGVPYGDMMHNDRR